MLKGLTNRKYNDLCSLSDEELMAHVHEGLHDALAVIVDRYQRLVWSIAQRIVRDEGEAEDVVQVVFLELFKKMELFNPARGTLKVWLLQLAYSRSINRRYHLQRRSFYDRVEVDDQEIAGSTASIVPMFRLNSGEMGRLVRQALETLKENQKIAIELIAFEGLTFEELAARTDETLANAKHHYYRGMIKLREYLSTASIKAAKAKREPTKDWEAANARAQSI